MFWAKSVDILVFLSPTGTCWHLSIPLTKSGECSLNSSKNISKFSQSPELQPVVSQNPTGSPVTRGAVLPVHCLERILLIPSCKPTSCTRDLHKKHSSINIRFVLNKVCEPKMYTHCALDHKTLSCSTPIYLETKIKEGHTFHVIV